MRIHRSCFSYCPASSSRSAIGRLAPLIALLAASITTGCARTPEPSPPAPLGHKIPLPPSTLLASSPPPRCEPSTSPPLPTRNGGPVARSGDQAAAPPASEPRDSLAYSLQLEFERDCLSAAERTTRTKLERLQVAVRKTVRAVRSMNVTAAGSSPTSSR